MLPYIKGVSETLCRTLQQQGIRTVFKSDTTLRSRLVRSKDPADAKKPDGLVYRTPYECGKVYIRETGRPMQERIKDHNRDIRLVRTESSAVLEHANETGHIRCGRKFIHRDSHWHTRKVKEAIHIRLNPNNINRHNGFEIPEAWISTIRKHQNKHVASQRTPEESIVNSNNSRVETHQSQHTNAIYNAATETVDPIG